MDWNIIIILSICWSTEKIKFDDWMKNIISYANVTAKDKLSLPSFIYHLFHCRETNTIGFLIMHISAQNACISVISSIKCKEVCVVYKYIFLNVSLMQYLYSIFLQSSGFYGNKYKGIITLFSLQTIFLENSK